MLKLDFQNEIIEFIKHSSETDNLIIATFIAGMQAQKSMDTFQEPSKMQLPTKPTKENPAS